MLGVGGGEDAAKGPTRESETHQRKDGDSSYTTVNSRVKASDGFFWDSHEMERNRKGSKSVGVINQSINLVRV